MKSNTLTPATASYFAALTGIRAIAAFLVFGHHLSLAPDTLPPGLITFLKAGHTGVTIFFVLSGFLITYKYKEALQQQHVSIGAYLVRRIARLYPLYFLLTILLLVWQKDFSGWHWFLNLTFLKGFFSAEKFTGIAQGWSLTVEECFYFTAPLLFLVLRKASWLYVVLTYLAGLLLLGLGEAAGATSFMQEKNFVLEFTFFGRCFEFYCGYLLAHQLMAGKLAGGSFGFYTLTGAVLFLAGMGVIAWAEHRELVLFGQIAVAVVVNNFILPLPVSLLFLGLLKERSFLGTLLSSRLFQVLGKSSYAFYLIHAGLFFEFLYFHFSRNYFLIFLVLNVLAVCLYYFIEKPTDAYLRRKLIPGAFQMARRES